MSVTQEPVDALPVPMQAVVGYEGIDCSEEDTGENKLVLKHDRFFSIITTHGDIGPPGRCSLGLFHDDTRILSGYELRLAGGPPKLLSAEAPRTYAAQIDLAVKDLPFGGDPWDPKHAVHIRRELVLSDRLGERVTLTDYLAQPLEFWLELSLACDFADIFEVRGWRRAERDSSSHRSPSGDRLLFRYRGRDGRTIGSVVRFLHPPDLLTARAARWDFTLASQIPRHWSGRYLARRCAGERIARVRAEASTSGARRSSGTIGRGARRAAAGPRTRPSSTSCCGARPTICARSIWKWTSEDVISAGIPWYSTVFGRDSIITSLETLRAQSGIARDTLRYLARRQGDARTPSPKSEPGKILHELRTRRDGPRRRDPARAVLRHRRRDAALARAAARDLALDGRRALVSELLPNAERALDWIDRYGDATATASWSTRARARRGW